MTSSSRSRRRFILAFLLIFLAAALLLQAVISRVLFDSKTQITDALKKALGYNIKIENISFSFIRGVRLSGISVFYDNQEKPCLLAKDVFLYLIPASFNRFYLARAYLEECAVFAKNEQEGLNILEISANIYSGLSRRNTGNFKITAGNLGIYATAAKIIFLDNNFKPTGKELLFKDFAFSLVDHGEIKLKGEARLTYRNISQNLTYLAEAFISGKDILVQNLLLEIAGKEILGRGSIKDFAGKNPLIEIGLTASIISIGDIEYLKEKFQADGYASISLRLNGPPGNIKTVFNANLYDCRFTYKTKEGGSENISGLNGMVAYQGGLLKLDNVSLKLNNKPMNVKLHLDNFKEPNIYLNLNLFKDYFAADGLPLNRLEIVFYGKMKETLTGNLELKASYAGYGTESQAQAYFNNIELDYSVQKEKYLKIRELEFIKNSASGIQKLNLSDFKSSITVDKKAINLSDASVSGYDGKINGKIFILKQGKTLGFDFQGRGLNVKRLAMDAGLTDKFQSGLLDTRAIFNNGEKEFLKGYCYVKRGTLDIGSLTEAIGLTSVRNINFDMITFNFAMAKDLVRIRGIKLSSPNVGIDGYWDIKKNLSGELNMGISSKILKESEQFKKLLSLAKINSPFVDFKFLLGGAPNSARVMWMKGEFKEKLEQASPEWVKRRIEEGIDKIIEGLSETKN